jgi:hypothetical protein
VGKSVSWWSCDGQANGGFWAWDDAGGGGSIGRLGVVSLPAIEAGLDLDERVVRRHVAKLEAAGWLGRAPWVWGEGSIVWLTGAGMESAGVGGLRPVKPPQAATTIAHGVLVGWSAARAEKRCCRWLSARELALDPDRWAVRMRCERGYTKQLPDLAVWLNRSGPPITVIAESGGRREDRQKWILEGWSSAIYSRHYSGVLYDCANDSVARWIHRLAKKAMLSRSGFNAVVQPRAEEIAALSPAVDSDDDGPPDSNTDAEPPSSREVQIEPAQAPEPSAPVEVARAPVPAEPRPETPEEAAERERRYRELLGIPGPRPRRRWRR